MAPKLILAAGIPRSGSTWLYNAARLPLEARYSAVAASWIGHYSPYDPAPVHLVKLHLRDEEMRARAQVVLLSRRDLRDIAASQAAIGWADSEERLLVKATAVRKLHSFWAERADVDLGYDEIVDAPLASLARVAGALCLDFNVDELRAVQVRIPTGRLSGASGFDPITLLHPGHITDGRAGRWRGELSAAVAEGIWWLNSQWLGDHGYGQL